MVLAIFCSDHSSIVVRHGTSEAGGGESRARARGGARGTPGTRNPATPGRSFRFGNGVFDRVGRSSETIRRSGPRRGFPVGRKSPEETAEPAGRVCEGQDVRKDDDSSRISRKPSSQGLFLVKSSAT